VPRPRARGGGAFSVSRSRTGMRGAISRARSPTARTPTAGLRRPRRGCCALPLPPLRRGAAGRIEVGGHCSDLSIERRVRPRSRGDQRGALETPAAAVVDEEAARAGELVACLGEHPYDSSRAERSRPGSACSPRRPPRRRRLFLRWRTCRHVAFSSSRLSSLRSSSSCVVRRNRCPIVVAFPFDGAHRTGSVSAWPGAIVHHNAWRAHDSPAGRPSCLSRPARCGVRLSQIRELPGPSAYAARRPAPAARRITSGPRGLAVRLPRRGARTRRDQPRRRGPTG
jgi:hypothetical protein